MRSRRWGLHAALAALALLAALACKSLPPVVEVRGAAPRASALRTVAVFPLRASEAVVAQATAAGASPGLPARTLANALAQDLLSQGVDVVTPSAIEGGGLAGADPTGAPIDPVVAAQEAARRFGASAVLLGTVQRWRERTGKEAAASTPASVAFGLALYEAPSGRRLFTARFDQTQHAANERPLEAARFPGGGSRWVSASELARWGSEETAKAIVSED